MDKETTTQPPAEQAQVSEIQGEELKTLTQEQLDGVISKRVNEVRKKYETIFEDNLAKAKAEWERQAKLSDDERLKEAQRAKIEELNFI